MPTTTGATASTYKTVLGIAKEPQPATGTPVPATDYIPVTKFDPVNKVAKLIDGAWRGSMTEEYGIINGPRSSEISFSGPCFLDTVGYLLAGIFGDLATTGTGPFTHTMALYNASNGQPTSYTITDSNAVSTRLYASSRFTELTLKYDAAQLLTYDAKTLGWVSATGSAPTSSYSSLAPVPSWAASITIGGTANATLTSWELSIKRNNSEAVMTLQNSQDPYEVHVGALTVDTKWTVVAADESLYTDYLNGTARAWVVDLTSGTTELKIQSTSTQHTDVAMQRGKSYIEFQGSSKALANSTDVGASGGFSPALVTLKNAKPSGTFG